jgi:hypothetical protein
MNNNRLKQITQELNENTSNDIVSVSYGFKTVNGKLTNEKSIIFTVKEKKPIEDIPQDELLPSSVDVDGENVNTDVIQGEIRAQGFGNFCVPEWTNWLSTPPQNRNVHRPLMGGVSTTNYSKLQNYVGTLGFFAVDNEDNSLVGVSNNHVLIDDAFLATERDPLNSEITNTLLHEITQPNEVGNSGSQYKVGIVKKYQPLVGANTVDAALVAIDDLSLVDPAVSWQQFGITGMTQAPRFATTSEINTLLENPSTEYYVSSRTTGPKGQQDTKLLNFASASSIYINYTKQGADQAVYMNDTFELVASGSTTPTGDYCFYPSTGGDSGSAILAQIESQFVIVGLLYGGRYTQVGDDSYPTHTLCNRIDNVASALNISAWDGSLNGIIPDNTSGPITHVVGGLSSQKTITVNGLEYWQHGLVLNSSMQPDPTPQPSPTATIGPTPTSTPDATPQPTPEPTGVVDPTPTPNPTNTPAPTATVVPQTLYLDYDHLNSCSTANLILSVNGVQQGGNINLTQGSTGSGTIRGPIYTYPGDVVSLQFKPFNLISPCTLSYQNPTVEVFNNTVSVATNSNDGVYSTYQYTVGSGPFAEDGSTDVTLLVEMNSSPVPTATPVPTYTLTLENVTSSTYAEQCAKGYITVEKNGSVVATLTKTQGNTYANWDTSSVSFTAADVVTMKSYSQGGGGSGCTALEDTTVRCVYNGSARTLSQANAGTNGQSYTVTNQNGTAFGWFFEVGIV